MDRWSSGSIAFTHAAGRVDVDPKTPWTSFLTTSAHMDRWSSGSTAFTHAAGRVDVDPKYPAIKNHSAPFAAAPRCNSAQRLWGGGASTRSRRFCFGVVARATRTRRLLFWSGGASHQEPPLLLWGGGASHQHRRLLFWSGGASHHQAPSFAPSFRSLRSNRATSHRPAAGNFATKCVTSRVRADPKCQTVRRADRRSPQWLTSSRPPDPGPESDRPRRRSG